MSIDIEKLIVEAGLVPAEYVSTPRWIGSVQLEARQVRALGLLVGYHPLPENPYHGQIWGQFTRDVQLNLRLACRWVVPIEQCEILPADA